jgi:hypothetical protein
MRDGNARQTGYEFRSRHYEDSSPKKNALPNMKKFSTTLSV